MVWPIIRGESYVREMGKSINAVELAVIRVGCGREVAIALIAAFHASAKLSIYKYLTLQTLYSSKTSPRPVAKSLISKDRDQEVSRSLHQRPRRIPLRNWITIPACRSLPERIQLSRSPVTPRSVSSFPQPCSWDSSSASFSTIGCTLNGFIWWVCCSEQSSVSRR